MNPEIQLLLWWAVFAGGHLGMSAVPVRTRLVGALGLRGFKALYSVVAVVGFSGLFLTYWGHRHEGALLFYRQAWGRHVTELIMLFAVLFVSIANATKRPGTTAAEMTGTYDRSARGIHRITRHPLNTGFGLFGLGHMIVNPTVGDWMLWGGLLVFALASAFHQDRRLLATGPADYKAFHDETSFFPFVAIAQGRQRLVLGEISWVAVVAGVVLYAAIRLLHPVLIGGFA